MTLEQLNKRIKTTRDLKDIVSTMKLMSSVSVGPYEKAFASAQEYFKTLEEAFLAFTLTTGWMPPKEKALPADQKRAIMIVIGTDNGLVGGFNREVLKSADLYLKQHHYPIEQTDLICIGRRLAVTNARSRKAVGVFQISNSIKELTPLAGAVLETIDQLTSTRNTHAVFLTFNEKKDQKIRPRTVQLMPLSDIWLQSLKKRRWEGRMQPMMPAPKEALLKAFSREYLSVVLAGALTASLSAEHYTRMLNMQQAEKNIEESLQQMDLEYQQARQTAVTDELIDIVSGAESLTKQLRGKGKLPLDKRKKKG